MAKHPRLPGYFKFLGLDCYRYCHRVPHNHHCDWSMVQMAVNKSDTSISIYVIFSQ